MITRAQFADYLRARLRRIRWHLLDQLPDLDRIPDATFIRSHVTCAACEKFPIDLEDVDQLLAVSIAAEQAWDKLEAAMREAHAPCIAELQRMEEAISSARPVQ